VERTLFELARGVENISGMFDDYAWDAAHSWKPTGSRA